MLFHQKKTPVELKIVHLNKKQSELKKELTESMDYEKKKGLMSLKALLKKTSKQKKCDVKEDKKLRAFVLDFDGDMKASAVGQLREEISSLLSIAKSGDEVVVRLESPGGMVHAYGLAAAQLARIKEAKIQLTICVDKIAASGGYMMACVADKIHAAPFAIIGSIGVVAQIPNFNKILKKHDVEYELFTAGDYKRTVTMFGENDAKGRAKFLQEIEHTHVLFKDFINTYRPTLYLEKVATGEHWYGNDAVELGLVDALQTSDGYIIDLMKHKEVYSLCSRKKPTLAEKIGLSDTANATVNLLIDKLPDAIARLQQDIRFK